MPEEVRHVNLRIPQSLHEQAVAQAKRERYSLNSWILVLIERAIRDAAKAKR